MAQLEPPPFEDTEFSWRWRQWLATNRENTVYRGALIQKNQAQSIPNGFLQTLVTFDEVGYDTGGLADLDNNQLIVPDDAHRVQIAVSLAWDEADNLANDSMRCSFLEVLDKNGNSNLDDSIAGTTEQNAARLRLQNIPGMIGSRQHFQEPLVITVQPMVMSFTTAIMDVEPGDRFRLRANVDQATDGSADIVTRAVATANVGANRCTWMSMVVFG